MISSRNKGTVADSYIVKGATKLSQANTVGFIGCKELERLITKLVSSPTKLWTPAPDLA